MGLDIGFLRTDIVCFWRCFSSSSRYFTAALRSLCLIHFIMRKCELISALNESMSQKYIPNGNRYSVPEKYKFTFVVWHFDAMNFFSNTIICSKADIKSFSHMAGRRVLLLFTSFNAQNAASVTDMLCTVCYCMRVTHELLMQSYMNRLYRG